MDLIRVIVMQMIHSRVGHTMQKHALTTRKHVMIAVLQTAHHTQKEQ